MRLLFAFTILLVFQSCLKDKSGFRAGDTPTAEDLSGLFEQYYQERLPFYPLEATTQGREEFNNQLPNDLTTAYRDSLRAFYTKYLAKAKQVNREGLSPEQQVYFDNFEFELNSQLAALKQPTHLLPFNQFWGLPITFGQLGSGEGVQPFRTTKDYDNWLERIDKFTVWADTAIVNFRKGMKAGYVLPKSLVERMLPQMEGLAQVDPTKSIFFGPVRRLPANFTEGQRADYTTKYIRAINTQLTPTYQKLYTFLKNEYLPAARTTSGIGSLPGGDSLYRHLTRHWTTTDLAPEQIYTLGEQEVARIRGEMQAIQAQVGFKGTLNDFFNHLRTDPKFTPYQTPEEVLAAFRNIQQRIEPHLNSMFTKRPKTPFEIRRTEAFREAAASAEYQQGSPDGKRPGIFYVPIPDARKFNITSGMESLFLHEAIPGHHFQISLQQENQRLPTFMRFSGHGAYDEGWALYTESLGKDLGLYTDPYQRMGALGDEIHRAIRLVVDVGLHAKGWTREQAIQYMLDNEAASEQYAVMEIERYMAIPGQALSYKIGSLKIAELRKRFEQQLGARFSLAAFHDELLKDGSLPLAVLEKKMERWAATKTDK